MGHPDPDPDPAQLSSGFLTRKMAMIIGYLKHPTMHHSLPVIAWSIFKPAIPAVPQIPRDGKTISTSLFAVWLTAFALT
jgi:hypothetical protein